MRSVRVLTSLAISSVALAGGALALSAPAASAATGPNSEQCEQAQVGSNEAQKSLDALKKSGASKDKIDAATEILEQAQVAEHEACATISGPVHTGAGGTQGGLSTTEMTAGAALIATAAAGGVVMMRRRSSEN
ncbi:hypothetical protein [Streptomyces beijiangensis]|uniref:LPXTG-motif cell wall anchor domain-containing protein n=1 Tax=Streptomyces beijiangensis TaxID=163361 RepID=A0A939FAZ4_9ACTN|nr:hypothetical protein [Streptomyces beijiangensis]MBO0514946.1 hypothetical protein [Streptomyces beijiangensis]